MRKQSASQSGVHKRRAVVAFALCPISVFLILSFWFLALKTSAQSLPSSGTFTAVASMNVAREGHTATLLGNGKILIAGGAVPPDGATNKVELFDPASGKFTALSNQMASPRFFHTATVLPTGKILIVGGYTSGGIGPATDTAELFDPASATFTPVSNTMSSPRGGQTATLLPNGKVLITGGFHDSTFVDTADLFDPALGRFVPLPSMSSPRYSHTATLLGNGKVLLAGGYNLTGAQSSAELFDPISNTFAPVPSTMVGARYGHTATLLANGKVLLAGGQQGVAFTNTATNTAEIFDPTSGTFTPVSPMTSRRQQHSATLLPSGQVLITGGLSDELLVVAGTNTAELFDPTAQAFVPASSMNSTRYLHTATLLPSGQILLTGGFIETGLATEVVTNTAELFDYAPGSFASTSSMTTARLYHTATLLPSGKVLVTGGNNQTVVALNTAEMFDPDLGTFTSLSPITMTTGRYGHSATLLPNGKVLIAGGYDGSAHTNKAELFDPVSATFTALPPMTSARFFHTATLLASGKVLIAGGYDGSADTNTAELFDPVARTFTALPPMTSTRIFHTATLLPSGKVLIAGGRDVNYAPRNTAELFDPVSATFTSLSPTTMTTGRYGHSATLLPNGKVLIAGRHDSALFGATNTAELFDPALGTFTLLPSLMNSTHESQTATLLGSGKVLIAGGYTTVYLPSGGSSSTITNTAELFDPVTGTFTSANAMNSMRAGHTATLLPGGAVLIAEAAISPAVSSTPRSYSTRV